MSNVEELGKGSPHEFTRALAAGLRSRLQGGPDVIGDLDPDLSGHARTLGHGQGALCGYPPSSSSAGSYSGS